MEFSEFIANGTLRESPVEDSEYYYGIDNLIQRGAAQFFNEAEGVFKVVRLEASFLDWRRSISICQRYRCDQSGDDALRKKTVAPSLGTENLAAGSLQRLSTTFTTDNS